MKTITEQSFLKDVATHQMQVIREDGVHRHVRFKKPGTMCAHFDLITWPGYLCYTGDMGTYVFRRLEDMFQFFRQRPRDGETGLYINTGYWAEKIEAADRDGVKEYSAEKFVARMTELLNEHIESRMDDFDEDFADADDLRKSLDDLRESFKDEVLDYADEGEHRAREAANEFNENGFIPADHDIWEYDFTEYTYRYVWCCYALAWGVKQYDAAKAQAVPA